MGVGKGKRRHGWENASSRTHHSRHCHASVQSSAGRQAQEPSPRPTALLTPPAAFRDAVAVAGRRREGRQAGSMGQACCCMCMQAKVQAGVAGTGRRW